MKGTGSDGKSFTGEAEIQGEDCWINEDSLAADPASKLSLAPAAEQYGDTPLLGIWKSQSIQLKVEKTTGDQLAKDDVIVGVRTIVGTDFMKVESWDELESIS